MIIGLINTGYSFEYSSAIELISKDFTFVPFEYHVKNGKVSSNVDVILWDGNETPEYHSVMLLHSLNIPILGLPRMSKLEQHLLFTKLNINCPEYFYAKTGKSLQLASLLESVDDDEPLIVKSLFGARGLQQFLMRRGALIRSRYNGADLKAGKKQGRFLTNDSQIKSKEIRKEVINDTEGEIDVSYGGNKEDLSYSKSFYKSQDMSDWLITKKVNVVKEYRVLAFKNTHHFGVNDI